VRLPPPQACRRESPCPSRRPETRLDDLAAWIRDLPLVVEILVWIVFFPQVLATAVWTSGWSEGLRTTLVVLLAAVWILISVPRPRSGRR
jgi:hypothetical protein